MGFSDKKIDEIIARFNQGEKIIKVVLEENISKEDYRKIRRKMSNENKIENKKNIPLKFLLKRKAVLLKNLQKVSDLIEERIKLEN